MNEIETIIEKLNEAYANGDIAAIGALVADDIVWDMKGSNVIIGRSDFDLANAAMKGMETLGMNIENIIVDGVLASANGTMKYNDQNGDAVEMAFCDVYKFSGGKNPLIKEMTSYVIPLKN